MKVNFIADIGSNHNRSMKRIKEMIDILEYQRFWGVKFQLFDASKMYRDKERADELKKLELPAKFIPEISEYCKDKKIKFGCTPFYDEAVDYLKDYVDFFKISSFDMYRLKLIKSCLYTEKRIMLSLGMRYLLPVELQDEIFMVKERSVVMHCVSDYPTYIHNVCAKRIKELKNCYGDFAEIGYSDHSASIYGIVAALLHGAEWIELHFDLNDQEGKEPVHTHCWSAEDTAKLTAFVNNMKTASEKDFILNYSNMKNVANSETGYRE